MASRPKRAVTKRKSLVKKAELEAQRFARKGNESAGGGKSARQGRRTTLRVPVRLEAEISRTAREQGISENEALVRLARLGAESARRERDIRRVTERRGAAVLGSADESRTTPLPSPGEVRDAILVDRD